MLLIAQQEFKFHEEPLQNPENRFDWDFKIIAREAMTQGARRRFADASFPPEWRLQVMKASVLQHVPIFVITPESTFDDVAKAATSLLDTQHTQYTTDAVYAVLQQTADQALLETCIFKIERDRKTDGNALDFTRSMAPALDSIGARIHHLEISVHSDPSLSGVVAIGRATETLHELKLHFPILKTCILTVKIQTLCFDGVNGLSLDYRDLDVHLINRDQTIFPIHLLGEKKYVAGQELGRVLTGLFGTFAEKGPGMHRFVRMVQTHSDQKVVGTMCHYGPLVDVYDGPRVISSGADIVAAAYRLARTVSAQIVDD
jgi:hypothetical protein